MPIIDARCTARRCADKDMYRMVGNCANCGTKDILMLFTTGHETRVRECPVCGTEEVRAKRLATEDEIPVDFEVTADA